MKLRERSPSLWKQRGYIGIGPRRVMGSMNARRRLEALLDSSAFYAPRTSSITQSRGTGNPTYTGATAKYVTDFEGLLKLVPSGAARFSGARVVRNLLTNTEALDNVSWTKTNVTVGTGVSDPDGGTTAFTITATAGNGEIYRNTGVSTSAGVASIWIKRRTGTGLIKMWDGNSYETIPVTSSWARVAMTHVVASALYCLVQLVTSGDAVDVWHPQAEDVTGQANQNPSEYVSVGVLSAPYHGAGVDGVKYFNTDISGNPIPAATLKGEVIEAAATQYLGVTGTPATQTTASLGTGTYTLWCEGTGSCIASAGTATITGESAASQNTPNTFTVTVAGTVTVTKTGALTRFNLTNTPYQTSYIENTGAAGTSTTRNKDVQDDQVSGNLTAAAGSVAFTWTPSHDPSGTIALCGSYVDASNYTVLLHDATKYILRKRIAGVNYDAELTAAYTNGTTAKGSIEWGAAGHNLSVDGVLGTANTTGIEGVQYGELPGTAWAYFSTPDSVANSITGDIDIRVKVALADWTPAADSELVGKSSGAGQLSYDFLIDATTGKLDLFISTDGTAFSYNQSSAATGFTDGTTHWVRVTRVASSGVITFYTSDDGVAWTQLGTTVSGTTGALFNGSASVALGAVSAGSSRNINGKIYRAQIYNGIDGTLAVDFNPADYTHGTTWTSSATGEVYTMNGNAAVWPAVKLGTRWQWGADGNGGQQAGAAIKEMRLFTKAISNAELVAMTL